MAGQGIGSPVSSHVAEQILARKKIIEKQQNRTNDDLLYMNAKTGWVKLSSSVNTLSETEIAQIQAGVDPILIYGSNITAGNNILLGGLLAPGGELRSGIDQLANPTAVDGTISYYAYQNRSQSSGIRPMPGITSMTVKSKNTYGTLREADVKFVCWTLEDFELIETIYLRPGFSVLLEWGHSLYVDNNGTLSSELHAIGNKYFGAGLTMSGLLNDITDLRTKASNNYEGMIGYIKNFSWNYTKEGAYECSVSIISTGEILESLKMRFDPLLRIPEADFTSTFWDNGKEQRKSIWHYIINKMESILDPTFDKAKLQTVAGTLVEDLEDFTGYYSQIYMYESFYSAIDTHCHWIPLRTYFDIFNKCISPVDRTKDKATQVMDRTLTRFNTDYEHSSKYLTSEVHFSIDPLTCVLPNPANLTTTRYWGLFGSKVEKVGVPPIHDSGAALPEGSTPDDVLNIYISSYFLKTTLNDALDKDGKLNKSMFDITETILQGINTALGGINDLGLAFNEELNGGTWHVVDRNNTPPDGKDIPIFTLAGIGSVFTDVSISSKISNEIGSQISIAAQSTAKNTSENISNILKWNPGVIDRLKVIKTDDPEPQELSEEEIIEKEKTRVNDWLTDVIDFFNSLQGSFTFGFDKADMEALKTTHAEWTNNNVAQRARVDNGQALPGLVPVELSFKLDGIGGFKIGESFKIAPGILPNKYQDRFGYIITGLEHSIGTDNRWVTSVTTQFFGIDTNNAQSPAGSNPPPGGNNNTNNPKPQNNNNNNNNNNSSKGGYFSKPVPKKEGKDSKKRTVRLRTIDGVEYINGQLPDSVLRPINNMKHYIGSIQSDKANPKDPSGRIRLYTKASYALDNLLAAAEADKVYFKINSGYRTYDDQVYVKGHFKKDGPAEPGTSNHGFGCAVDFAYAPASRLTPKTDQYKWLIKNAAKFGFKRLNWAKHTESWEAWHWEYQI